MKKQFVVFMIIFLGLSWACSKDEDNLLPVIEPDDSGVFTDAEGREFSWVRYGNLEWMRTNLNIEASVGSEISHEGTRDPIKLETEKEQNYVTFGYLYTYEAAKEVVPEGWRIPTDNDWQELEKAMGMSANELNVSSWRGVSEGTLLQQTEGTRMNLRMGGMGEYDGYGNFSPYFSYVYGFYWTSTPEAEGSNYYYCRQISYKSGQIARVVVDKSKMLSVRCVRDAR